MPEIEQGRTLETWLTSPSNWKTDLGICKQLLSALQHIHSEGVFHRDLKPENIMIDGKQHLTLLDFGVARKIPRTQMTRSNSLVGTPLYFAPERQAHSEYAIEPAEAWSLGILLFQIAYKQWPFDDDNRDTVSFPERTDVPEEFQTIVLGLLQKDPAKRLTSEKVKMLLEQMPLAT